ncbi:MAG: DUF2249 domain-containing protein [Candidatus Schekmanbacteria bacterium]|nr:DUF2249 domain-containing protein [Candidatus Schekmanbacteria bacterium]
MAISLERDYPLIELRQEGSVYHLDVRALIEQGGEPYPCIMSCVGQLDAQTELVVHAPFKPAPLVRQLERMGLESSAAHVGPDHWTLTIRR